MKGLAVLLIVVGAGLGVYSMSYDGGGAFMGAAVVCLVVGVILFFVSAFVSSKKKDLMSQMEQSNAASAGSMTGQTTSMDVQGMMGLDANDILSSVMEAQQAVRRRSGGDGEDAPGEVRRSVGGRQRRQSDDFLVDESGSRQRQQQCAVE
ncbi:MAG: hypothetical protein JJE13_12820 [Thermoleophilia bacterium]|nr:hypothetical protein [Thermoleophilia bacterium]